MKKKSKNKEFILKNYTTTSSKQNTFDSFFHQLKKGNKPVQHFSEFSNGYSKPKKKDAKILYPAEFYAEVGCWKKNTDNGHCLMLSTKGKNKANSQKVVGACIQIEIRIPNMNPSELMRIFHQQSNVIFDMSLGTTTIQSESSLRRVRNQVLKALSEQLKRARGRVENCA